MRITFRLLTWEKKKNGKVQKWNFLRAICRHFYLRTNWIQKPEVMTERKTFKLVQFKTSPLIKATIKIDKLRCAIRCHQKVRMCGLLYIKSSLFSFSNFWTLKWLWFDFTISNPYLNNKLEVKYIYNNHFRWAKILWNLKCYSNIGVRHSKTLNMCNHNWPLLHL